MDKCKVGQTFNWFTVIEEPFFKETPKKIKGFQKVWFVKCLCRCGTEKIIRVESIVKGTTKSCGCYNLSIASKRGSKANLKHNLVKHPLYGSWKSMNNKCYNKNSTDYFGGDITVCDEWKVDFKTFYDWAIQYWSEGFVISRRDEMLSFNPNNCYFRSKGEIARNNNNPEKAKGTCLEKYGVEHPLQNPEILAKTKATNNARYGGNSPFSSKEIIEKIKRNNILKYGVSNIAMLNSTKEKMAKTCFKKFGTKSPSENQEVKQKQINTCMSRYGVPYFTKTYGKIENEIQKLLETWSNKKFYKNTYIICGKELDIYNDEMKLAIEYCGLYWHTEGSPEPRNYTYHYSKYKTCLEQGIRLITIFSDEWKYRKPQVMNFLKSVVGIYEQKIFARKCNILEVPKKEAELFMEENHIQGPRKGSKFFIGLYYENELIGCLTIGTHHRQNHCTAVLDRMCFKDGVQVIGGASRMFKKAIDWSRINGYTKIVSWSDSRWTQGKIYETLGFILEDELKPDYSYVKLSDPNKRYSKQSHQKKHIGAKEGQTEKERMIELGYSRIFDCGKKRWGYQL